MLTLEWTMEYAVHSVLSQENEFKDRFSFEKCPKRDCKPPQNEEMNEESYGITNDSWWCMRSYEFKCVYSRLVHNVIVVCNLLIGQI